MGRMVRMSGRGQPENAALWTEVARDLCVQLGNKMADGIGFSHEAWQGIRYKIEFEFSVAEYSAIVALKAEKDGTEFISVRHVNDEISGNTGWLAAMMETYMSEVDIRGEVLFFKFYKMFEKHVKHVRTDGDRLFVQFQNGMEVEGSTMDTLDPEFLAKCAMVYDLKVGKEEDNGSSN